MEANNVNNTKKNTAGSKINAYQICLVALAVTVSCYKKTIEEARTAGREELRWT